MKLFYTGPEIIKAHPSDLGFDIPSAETLTIAPHTTAIVKTGIRIAFPENVGGLIKDRSSMAKRGLFVHGGVIDPDYTGEIRVVLYNSNDFPVSIKAGDRIAQLLLFPLLNIEAVRVDSLDEFEQNKLRKDKGFGSSGR